MLSGKNRLKTLEKNRTIFFLIGLVISLALVTIVINWKFYDNVIELEPIKTYNFDPESDDIPITTREKPKKVSKPIATPEEIKIVEDIKEIEDELEIGISETDEDEAVTHKNYVFTEGEPEKVVEILIDEEDDDEPLNYAVVENVPIFPGCDRQLSRAEQAHCFEKSVTQYVASHINYNEEARLMRLSGRIFVEFVIEKDGNVAHIKVLRGLDPLLDDEAIKAVESIPQMIPANQRGEPVRMKYILPIYMKLQE